MIYTLTLNPAIDYVILTDDFSEGKINRTSKENIYAGGKGINVSCVLSKLGIATTMLGFVAGHTGRMLTDMLGADGFATDFIQVKDGMTRINVKMSNYKKASCDIEDDRLKESIETEINGAGPVISRDDYERLLERLAMLEDGDILIMSGSIPSSMPDNLYSEICRFLKDKGIAAQAVIDSSSKGLLEALEYKPLLVKPNHHELGDLFGVEITSFEAAISYARKLHEMGAMHVLVSMGEKGAVLIDNNGDEHIAEAVSGKVISSVGAGDTTVAAFVSRYMSDASGDYDKILKYCVAAGSATAFMEGLAGEDDIQKIYSNM